MFIVRCLMFNLALFYALLLTHCTGFTQAISSRELINNSKQYDAKIVIYEGEVIGDVMQRGDFTWVNINDGNNAIGVWIESSLAKDIQYTGSFKARGDWFEAKGVFHTSCTQHGGDLDIHAQSMRRVSAGKQIKERLNPAKRNFSLILLGILFLVWILTLLKKR